MCGIFVTVSPYPTKSPDKNIQKLLSNRGPDSSLELTCNVIDDVPVFMSFFSTVLAMRGDSTVCQPMRNTETGSILCWNGELWRNRDILITGNDTLIAFQELCRASKHPSPIQARNSIYQIIEGFSGPFSFVFWDSSHEELYFGRDCLGRRSLLHSVAEDGSIMLSSVGDGNLEWKEVDADGIYNFNISHWRSSNPSVTPGPTFNKMRWRRRDNSVMTAYEPGTLLSPLHILNKACPTPADLALYRLGTGSASVTILAESLKEAVRIRLLDVSTQGSVRSMKTAILFSGGLDCTLLARIAHEVLPLEDEIDLLNVAFENPRVNAAAKIGPGNKGYQNCPDRETGLASFQELKTICSGRKWRFVEIDVPYAQTVESRDEVVSLMHPHKTEMDLSIAIAFYFGARGTGFATTSDGEDGIRAPYRTTARVFLSGLGADEIFGGYGRHKRAFERGGYTALLHELELDIDRLSQRNLGRDDRILAHWAREVRYPFLDEEFFNIALGLPVWEKLCFGTPLELNEGTNLIHGDLGKAVLRLLAWKLGMKNAATAPKRAIQFGARSAKMTSGKVRGTQIIASSESRISEQ